MGRAGCTPCLGRYREEIWGDIGERYGKSRMYAVPVRVRARVRARVRTGLGQGEG